MQQTADGRDQISSCNSAGICAGGQVLQHLHVEVADVAALVEDR
ncbi:hypothetical protein [Rhodococcus phenolicus]|nr:hypothetical protein [Rhodococcus phenolicus]